MFALSLDLAEFFFILVCSVPVNQEDIIQKAKSLKKYNKLPQSFLDECPSEKKNTLKTPAPSKKETTKV